jgi:DNA ligase 1
MSAPFFLFCQVCEQVAATTKKLAKAAILQPYLAALPDDDLVRAARFLAGAPFPLHDARVLNVGGAVIREVVLGLSGGELDEWRRLNVQLGEPGEAAGVLLQGHAASAPTLTLAAVDAAFVAIEAARGPSKKAPLLRELLSVATVLEARYLIKIITGELRIGLQEGQLEDALARAAGLPVGAVQWANMLLGDIGETALRARHGTLGEARMRLFHPLKFMLASPIQDPQEIRRSIGGSFFVEDKYDGIRGQAHIGDGRVALFSRTLDDVSASFPELAPALQPLGDDLILDGEVLAAKDGRILPFRALQPRLGRKQVSAELLAQTPVVFVVYDLLYHAGEVLLEVPLRERRRRLEALFQNAAATQEHGHKVTPSLLYEVDDLAQIDTLFDGARGRGNEGLMVKDPQSSYKPGRRGREWLKVKKALATLDVVITAAEWGSGKRRKFLSDYTFAVRASEDDATLLNVGKAYSGLTDPEVQQLTDWLLAHTIQDFGRVRLVEPQIVLEVAFDVVQPSKRHKSGYALRFPRIVRIRDDKPPSEIDTLDAVRRLAQESESQDAVEE